MAKYQINNHSVLKVTKQEAEQGSSWNDLARRRANAQHGEGEEIPEGDIHHIPKIDYHAQVAQSNPEETKTALDALAEKIKHLQSRIEKPAPPPLPPPVQQPEGDDDETVEDWYKD